MNKVSLKKFFIISIVLSLILSALTGIFVLLKGGFDDTDLRVLLTTLFVGIYSITSLANIRNLDSGHTSFRTFAVTSITISVSAFALSVFLIWLPGGYDDENLYQIATSLFILAISSAHISLLLPFREKSSLLSLLVTGTLGSIILVATMLIYLIWQNFEDVDDFYYRLLGVFAILDALGTIICPILARFTQKESIAQDSQSHDGLVPPGQA